MGGGGTRMLGDLDRNSNIAASCSQEGEVNEQKPDAEMAE